MSYIILISHSLDELC